MYQLDITPKNPFADGKFFNNWLKNEYSVKGIIHEDSKVSVMFFIEPPEEDKTAVRNKYASLGPDDTMTIEHVKNLYAKRRADGDDYFETVRAEFALEYMNGAITAHQAAYIENKLITVVPKLILGDWLTAQYQLTHYVIQGTQVSDVDVANGYSQQRHDKLVTEITEYITENY